jgi:phosphoserine phosphatase
VESLDFAVKQALASQPGGKARAAELAEITNKGMAGALDFRQSLEQRIAIAGLTSHDIVPASIALAERITPGMFELTGTLREKGHGVFAVSGGFLELLGPALSTLGFMPGDVRANRFEFDEAGAVTGFDRDNPLSRSGGKAVAVRALKNLAGASTAVMVGDGMTDYEAFAEGAADVFIGFGGVVRREPVAAKAPAYAGSVGELATLLGV